MAVSLKSKTANNFQNPRIRRTVCIILINWNGMVVCIYFCKCIENSHSINNWFLEFSEITNIYLYELSKINEKIITNFSTVENKLNNYFGRADS